MPSSASEPTPPAPAAARAGRRERLQLLSGLLSGFAGIMGGVGLVAAGKVRVGSVTLVAGLLAAGLPPLVRRVRSRRRGG